MRPEPSPPGAEQSLAPRHRPNSRQRILVVDDDPDVRRVSTAMLIYSGYHADAAEDGAAAWDDLRMNNYDLVITDNNMPRMTGVELIEKLRDARMDLPVILTTGASPDGEFSRRPWLQPNIVLRKPHNFNELLVAVKGIAKE